MKLSNCKSQKFLHQRKQHPIASSNSKQNVMEEQFQTSSSQISILLQKLKNLQQKQQNTKNHYLTKIQQLKTILAQQNITSVNLQQYLKDLRKQNEKQLIYLEQLKGQVIKQIYQSNNGKNDQNCIDLMKSCDGFVGANMIKPAQTANQRQKSQNKGGMRLLKSMNLREIEKRGTSRSTSRSKISLFKSTSTLFGKNSQTLLKKTVSTKDFIKIQSQYFQQDFHKY